MLSDFFLFQPLFKWEIINVSHDCRFWPSAVVLPWGSQALKRMSWELTVFLNTAGKGPGAITLRPGEGSQWQLCSSQSERLLVRLALGFAISQLSFQTCFRMFSSNTQSAGIGAQHFDETINQNVIPSSFWITAFNILVTVMKKNPDCYSHYVKRFPQFLWLNVPRIESSLKIRAFWKIQEFIL